MVFSAHWLAILQIGNRGRTLEQVLHACTRIMQLSYGPATRSTFLSMGTRSLEPRGRADSTYTGDAPYLNDALRAGEGRARGSVHVDVDAPDALAKSTASSRRRSSSASDRRSRGAQTRQGQAGDAAAPRTPLRAEPAERDARAARARVLEPP